MGERRGTKGLELWCRKMTEGYPGVKIDNMTTSWRDGLAFCAMIHHFRPDLIDFEKLNKDDVYHNNELAFRVAEHHLGIPALLEPEDMVEYTVPDRLSILTYLSQFYQAFAVPHGSSARIGAKRPQTSPDHGIVSPTSTSPPSKVAFTGTGKIRREPCAKCSLPVFIAERLNVGKLLYHRTCFRCARCNSQLTLANYYETENGEFCCEICPDEEKMSAKTSPEKSVLLRSMSDEEKTASLKTFSNEPDGYSAIFETALESIKDDNLKTDFVDNRRDSSEFLKARSHFFQSQLEYPSDSGNEDEPPDLPKSAPPKLDKSELNKDAVSLKDSVVISSAHSDSGFPNNRPNATVNIDSSKSSLSNKYDKSSVEVDKTHNIVTKDKSATEGDTSLVKARMRLFETNKSMNITEFRKSDVRKNSQNTEKVPLASVNSPTHHHDAKDSPIPIVKLDDLENFKQLSEKELQNNTNLINDKKDDTEKSVIPVSSDSFINKDSISNKYIGEKDKVHAQEDKDKILNMIGNVPDMEQKTDKPQENVKKEFESPSSTVNDLKDNTKNNIETSEDSVITISDSSREHENSVVTIEESDENQSSRIENVSQVLMTDMSSDVNYQTADVIPSELISKLEYESADTSPSLESPADANLKTSSSAKINETPKDEDYPDELNPFGEEDEDEEKGKQQPNASLNPFEDDDSDEESAVVSKPVPSPRVRRKILPFDSDREITGTPEHLSHIYIQRISVNPFESDDEESSKSDTKPPMPATRKKKIIAAPKISLNPFYSEDEENEDNNIKQPVPKPRISRASLGVPEPKPREAGGLSLATRSNFGSNTSISSGSAYGSVRKKKAAPKPPIPGFKSEYHESATSSLTSSPSHSVQHSPRSTPKYRKSKKAPPPPTSSTPVLPHQQTESVDILSSTALSPITLTTTEPILKDNEHGDIQLETDIEQEKIVKDEMNRNRQSQNVNLQSPTSSDNSSSLSAPNKSTYGKWKRRKGQAPTRPIPQRRTIKCLPMTEIRRELEIIEIQQQGLEKQGVRLEQIIREKCEGTNTDSTITDDCLPIDVEDLILQLFELVNEKNELFRKQAELMYLRRQQRLEEEHADVEYQIRCLMLQPEANKTDSDKAREEELINRLVEIVERRNEIIECLEMDRVREAEEDDSINNHINMYTLKRDGEKLEPDKLQKEKDKDKKKHKKEKKSKYKNKGHKIDADKDIDETEACSTLEKKKKKKFNIF